MVSLIVEWGMERVNTNLISVFKFCRVILWCKLNKKITSNKLEADMELCDVISEIKLIIMN